MEEYISFFDTEKFLQSLVWHTKLKCCDYKNWSNKNISTCCNYETEPLWCKHKYDDFWHTVFAHV